MPLPVFLRLTVETVKQNHLCLRNGSRRPNYTPLEWGFISMIRLFEELLDGLLARPTIKQ